MLLVVVVVFSMLHGEHFTVLHRQRKSGKSDFAVSANMAYGQVKLGGLVESMRIQTSWLDLDEVGEEVEGTMNQQDVQLPMSSLLVNQRLGSSVRYSR